MSSNQKSKNELQPKLRFPEFRDTGDWEEMSIGDKKFATLHKGKGISKSDIVHDGKTPCIRYGELYTHYGEVIDKVISKTNCSEAVLFFSKKNDVIIPSSGETKIDIATASCVELDNIALGGDINVIRTTQNGVFLSYYFNGALKHEIAKLAQGDSVVHLYPSQLEKINLLIPKEKEQQKIADCLSSLDELIEAEDKKLDALQLHKKGLMQELFPAKGETIPSRRFHEFRNAKAWQEQPLEKFLDYLQPTPYLVADTQYSDNYKTPVLTAGKTFLLGYTNEQHGIFKDGLPVIIFDDFTTATQFVDFPFKAKSSAMKILQAKNGASIKFMYEALQMIAYEVGTHERHWISKFAPMQVSIPVDPQEQQRIADFLSSIDEIITAQSERVDALRYHKKGLMQQLFPAVSEVQE